MEKEGCVPVVNQETLSRQAHAVLVQSVLVPAVAALLPQVET